MTKNTLQTERSTDPQRSAAIKRGVERAPHRSLLRATGQIREETDFDKPFIAVCNSYVDIIPGHVHLQEFGKIVKAAIRAAGGVPFEFNTIGVDDGIVMGHEGMRYSLPSRELIADCVETMATSHCFDAMICIPNCDKIIPGMLMGAARVNIPTIFLSGGPMMAGVDEKGQKSDLITVFEAVGKHTAGQDDRRRTSQAGKDRLPDLRQLQRHVHGQFDELPVRSARHRHAWQRHHPGRVARPARTRQARAATQILELFRRNIRFRDIVTADAIDNAMALDVAMGGSTNTVLHVLALAAKRGSIIR